MEKKIITAKESGMGCTEQRIIGNMCRMKKQNKIKNRENQVKRKIENKKNAVLN